MTKGKIYIDVVYGLTHPIPKGTIITKGESVLQTIEHCAIGSVNVMMQHISGPAPEGLLEASKENLELIEDAKQRAALETFARNL